jgi:hypothetical protein
MLTIGVSPRPPLSSTTGAWLSSSRKNSRAGGATLSLVLGAAWSHAARDVEPVRFLWSAPHDARAWTWCSLLSCSAESSIMQIGVRCGSRKSVGRAAATVDHQRHIRP